MKDTTIEGLLFNKSLNMFKELIRLRIMSWNDGAPNNIVEEAPGIQIYDGDKLDVSKMQNLNYEQKQELFLELRKDFKKRFKTDEKKNQRIKFVVGKHYYLLTKAPFGDKRIYREFVLKKFCYCRNDMPLNILILKEVSDFNCTKYTLNRNDCLKYHVKYEPGLQIFPMSMRWNEKES